MTEESTVSHLRVLYPVWVFLAIFSIMVVPSIVFVEGEAIQTANNLISNELIFRIGFIGSIFTQILFVLIPLLLYQLFKSVDNNQAMLMVAFALVSVPITIINEMHKLTAISFLDNPDQMMNIFEINIKGQIIPSIFWGLWLFPLGKLVMRSGFFPKTLGWLLIISGVGYVSDSINKLLAIHSEFLGVIFETCTFGEIIFILWFVIKGIKKSKTTAQQNV